MYSNLKEKISIPLVIVLSFLVQTTVAPNIRLLGIQPDIILIVVITLALIKGPMVGAVSGFFGGLLKDLILLQTLGLDALSKTITGYFVGKIHETVGFSIPLGIGAVFLGSFASELIRLTLSYLLGLGEVPFFKTLVQTILPFSFYNALLFPLIYLFIVRIAIDTRDEYATLMSGNL